MTKQSSATGVGGRHSGCQTPAIIIGGASFFTSKEKWHHIHVILILCPEQRSFAFFTNSILISPQIFVMGNLCDWDVVV